ncbi:hypothetical protein [Vibrio pectenicida]|uniref:Uncharacterized protein n=1 Tax=Vibrio pectenicida TaxID=62763 RepID=A0A3R9F8V8_9VIBR|nr:hypothetical protein [Vibrio pectenicida]RSD32543.1 hypothetical protein EJA03_02945 [Vibrio pectenicida]
MSNKQNAMIVSDERIHMLDSLFSTIDTDMAISMSFVRRAQKTSLVELGEKISGLNTSTLRRYMQQSYPCMRPIHVVAAMSWVLMVPMTSFYYALKVREHYRGMDDKAIEALYCVGRLPEEQFYLYLKMVSNLMGSEARAHFDVFQAELLSETTPSSCYDDLLPPKVLDINSFAIDYYRSIAITLRRFRQDNNIPIDVIARVLGLTEHQYVVLEDTNKIRDFSVAIGFRVKVGFELYSHVNFTSEMQQFPQFHQLRQHQHIRDSLIVESFRLLNTKSKSCASDLLSVLSKVYIKNET